MLLVRTAVAPSPIEGLGLFARQSIAAGEVIARWDGRFGWSCTDEELRALPSHAQEFVWRYGWRGTDGRWLVSVDNSRFLNHSFAPNTIVTVEAGNQFVSTAARSIAIGEEITEDYRQFDPDFAGYGEGWR
ncbi:MAG TPA: SET domain-containing protein-lysine N-methyltransferase [Gaiellaceae bacterium]|nr:SET domain-containing protein-lysine N-methyltransferase [Gaiellaceae bacterium]